MTKFTDHSGDQKTNDEENFDPSSRHNSSVAGYDNSLEHLLDELGRLDLLLQRRVQEWRAEIGVTEEFRGLYVSDEEIDRLLQSSSSFGWEETDSTASGAVDDSLLSNQVERKTRQIDQRRRKSLNEGVDLRLATLADRFDLDRLEQDILLIALAPELDRKYEKVYAYLRDDLTKRSPTVDLTLRVTCRTEAGRLRSRRLFSKRASLRSNRLVQLSSSEGGSLLSRTLTVDGRIVDFLLGGDQVDVRIAAVTEVISPRMGMDGLLLDTPVLTEVEWLNARLQQEGARSMTGWFAGPDDRAKEDAIEALYHESKIPIVRADTGTYSVEDEETIELLIREARLREAVLHLTYRRANTVGPNTDGQKMRRPKNEGLDLRKLVQTLDRFEGSVFLSTDDPPTAELQREIRRHKLAVIDFPRPSYELRCQLWAELAGQYDDVDPSDLASKFRLTRDRMMDAVSAAEDGDGAVTAESLYAACRAQSREALDSLAKRVEPTYDWDDIVLPDDAFEHLREVATHIRHRGTVTSEWGFGEKFSLGNGLNVLFTGSSGTGKTMAAEIIANDAELDLYKIDLATVVSKYIGETEENLGRIFDEAANSDAILFFDEADALFGKRTEVGDSHDRYANIEVNYLLQRVEEHDGTVILTTNFKQNIDNAFKRRIHVSVDFPQPDEESREAIWRGIFPEETPIEELNYEFLAGFELTGGNIKNAALTAAYLAADDGIEVGMYHVVRATRRELQKTGKLLNPDQFSQYQDVSHGK
jgi:hypothetical protein